MNEEQNATKNVAENEQKLHALRHTLAHLLGAAVLELYPGSKLTLGPAVENGFYYDIDLGTADGGIKIGDDVMPKIEAKMREILPTWTSIDRREVSADEAKNEFKNELIEE